MANSAIFTLTSEQLAQIRQWQRDEVSLEGEIAERQRKLASVREKLKAISVLGVEIPQGEAADENDVIVIDDTSDSEGSSLTEAIERLANVSRSPLSKKELKAKLLAENFAENRLGAYFYTVLMRLKKKGRISILDDGSVWKAG